MTIRTAMTLLALCTSSAAPLAAQRPQAMTDSARLQGTWTMVSGSASGVGMTPDMAAMMKRVANGNEVTITMSGQLYFKAMIVLNPSATPKTIDYHMTAGPTAGATQLGIYEIKGDTARFFFAAPKATRPASFAPAAGDERTLSTWVRAKARP